MTPYAILFAVLAALYAIESVEWVAGTAFVYRARPRGAFTPAVEIIALLAGRWRAYAGAMIPGTGGVAACARGPSPIGPTGVCSCREAEAPGRQTARMVPFAGLVRITADGTKVTAGSRVLLRAASAVHARQLAALLTELSRADEDARARSLEGEMRAMLATRAARRQVARYRAASRALAWMPQALFAALFLGVPAGLALGGLFAALPVLGVVLALMIGTAVRFFSLHRRLEPGDPSARWQQMLVMLVAPHAAMRADGALGRDLFGRFHALALARAAGPVEEARRLASEELREIAYPTRGEREPCCEAADWSRGRWSAIVREWIGREIADPAELLAPPLPQSPGSCAYCPRCRVQYTRADGECADCAGISLVGLEAGHGSAIAPAPSRGERRCS